MDDNEKNHHILMIESHNLTQTTLSSLTQLLQSEANTAGEASKVDLDKLCDDMDKIIGNGNWSILAFSIWDGTIRTVAERIKDDTSTRLFLHGVLGDRQIIVWTSDE